MPFQEHSEGMESMYGNDPQAELANLHRIFQEYSKKLGAKPPTSNNIPTIFWEYLPILLGDPFHTCFSYLLNALDSRVV